MRRMWTGTAVTVLLLAIAAPAESKVMIAGTISGPGLTEPIDIGSEHMDALWDSGFMQSYKAPSFEALGLSRSELGPRYWIEYRFDLDFDMEFEPTDPMVRQDVYPYAPHGQPVTYMPAQDVTLEGGMTVAPGWWVAPASFLDFLVEQGMPDAAPASSAAPIERTPSLPWPWFALALSLAAAGTAALLARRRSASPVAR